MVFEKMKSEGFAGNDEVRLKTAIRIPKTFVGRIIGKAGKNVRELQRVTGAMIKLPEDPATQGDEVTVEVFGNFMSTQVSDLFFLFKNIQASCSWKRYKNHCRAILEDISKMFF